MASSERLVQYGRLRSGSSSIVITAPGLGRGGGGEELHNNHAMPKNNGELE